ncbi:MAG: AAA family ATPase [Actinomycetota bacterium]
MREKRPSLVTLVGPPGIGKSRLADDFARRASERWVESRTVRGRCQPHGQSPAYEPLAEILKADAGVLDGDPPDSILEKVLAVVTPRLPQTDPGGSLSRVLVSSIGVAVGMNPLAGAEPAAARGLIARSWREYFESLTSRQAVLAIIEDIHSQLAGGGDVDAALSVLVDRGLVHERPRSTIEGERELVFNHVLTRDAAYAVIEPIRQRQAHARVLGWLEEMTGESADHFGGPPAARDLQGRGSASGGK